MALPDIYPYKFKNRDAFYNRNHDDVSLLDRELYWVNQIKKCVEGWWVNDDGTWFCMMPKLYFYINLGVIVRDTPRGRVPAPPTFTDREAIIMTYLLCCLGFSGFYGDEYFTCNHLVSKIENGEKINKRTEEPQLEALQGVICDSHGKMKKYVEPWEYLTKHYLVREPQGKPLGLIAYDNPIMDAFIFGTRNSGKTYTVAGGFFCHEFYLGGVKKWENIGSMNRPTLFGVGSSDEGKVKLFLDVFKTFMKHMPGGYEKDGFALPPPLYRKLQGLNSNLIKHEYIGEDGNLLGSGARIKNGVYQVETPSIFVGDRYDAIFEDEVGLNPIIRTSYAAEKNSTYDKTQNKKTGPNIKLGTSNEMTYVDGSKEIFYNPGAWGVFGVPNYYEAPDKKTGLFLSDVYVNDQYKDAQGNTIIDESHEALLENVKNLIESGASAQQIKAYEKNNPIVPSQMFVSVSGAFLPGERARMRRQQIEQNGEIRYLREVGRLERAGKTVRFVPDPRMPVVDSYTRKTTKVPHDTGVCIYERPMPLSEAGLYKMTYDTIARDGPGLSDEASLSAAIMWKGIDITKSGIQGGIVAVWLWRDDSLAANHDRAIMLADYYGAKILHEDDVGDFVTHCRNAKRTDILAPTPVINNTTIKITGNPTLKVGVRINSDPELKNYALKLFADWLMRPSHSYGNEDEDLRKVDVISDLRLLDEIDQFDDGNFDLISACLIYALWDRAETDKVYKTGERDTRTDAMRAFYRMAQERAGNTSKTGGQHENHDWRTRRSGR